MNGAPRLFLIDGNNYIFRAFFAPPPLHADGPPNNAVYGFVNMLLNLIERHQPRYLAVALDSGPTFRHELFAGYKANRPPKPPDLERQIPYVLQALEALKIPLLQMPGYEADDVIASACARVSRHGCDCVIVSSDKDFMQLVSGRVKLFDSAKNRWTGAVEVQARFGVPAAGVVEVLALMGDAVDNIPGVKGIGHKTASALIRHFQSIDLLFARLEHLESLRWRSAARLRRCLEAGKEAAFLSRRLATVRSDLTPDLSLADLQFTGIDKAKLRDLFALLNRLKTPGRVDAPGGPAAVD